MRFGPRLVWLAPWLLATAALPAESDGGGLQSARASAEASAQVREEARRAALRNSEERLRRAAAHARMPSTMYASTPDPAVPDHPFPISQAVRREPVAAPAVPKSHLAGADAAPAASAKEANVQQVWLFLGASEDSGREGFLRVVNHSAQAGEVRIEAVDDDGTAAGPVTLSIGASQAIHLNSEDLEGGNAGKGLPTGIGPGQGDWRLSLSSALDIEALSYVRTKDGFVTTMHDAAPTMDDGSLRVAFLNPGSNYRQESRLRLVNPGAETATIRIVGTDDAGQPGTEAVTAEVPAGQSRTFTAAELESGEAPGLSGELGDGTGKWRLRLESERETVAMSLLAPPTGHLANLSAPPPEAEAGGARTVPLFLSASDPSGREGFLRVVNRSDTAGTVRIEAFDESDFAYDPVTLSLDPGQTRHFNSDDLENGNAGKGLSGSTGAGRGDWRLELTSELDIQVLAYIRTKDGFVTSMHDLAPAAADGLLHRVAFLNPGSNHRQASKLRLVNRGAADAEATIEGIDDAGRSPGTAVRVIVPAGKAVSLESKALEEGGEGFEGALGNGKGKWRLWVTSDRPLLVASLLDTPTEFGHVANLSTAPGRGAARPSGTDAEAEAFRTLASPVVQSKCVNCHVEGGASGNTRLVFVTDADADHLAKNLRAFKSLLESVNDATGDGADYVLGKIQGVSHGGGVQAAAGTDDFAAMERFLGVLEGGDSGPVAITPANLFEGVAMKSPRSTLRRAAIVFAGRTPTDAEYESIRTGGAAALRRAIRGLMVGPGFHDFLIRGANDRLLTDRSNFSTGAIDAIHGYFVDFNNLNHSKRVAALRRFSDTWEDPAYRRWLSEVAYGVDRAPLELVAHVVENDLPYAEVLTADYIMANPATAEAYGADTQFSDPSNPREFVPSEIVSYYRRCDGHEMVNDLDTGTRVIDPGPCATDYPHAGILNTTVFLLRYPTTATNRNRARSRWTYYHFLGLDIEKSASRTTDPVALADTNNPTMHNAACTVCHGVLDPVAGAFQNYGDEGLYRDKWGGLDSLDGLYKHSPAGTDHPIHAPPDSSREAADVVTASGWLSAGAQEIGLLTVNEDDTGHSNIHVDYLKIRDESGAEVRHYELQDLADEDSDRAWDGRSFEICCETLVVPVDIPSSGAHEVEVGAWLGYQSEDAEGHPGTLRVSIGGPFYRSGDTWYRDMREPGFDGELVPNADNSLQWLAKRIVADPRFAEATVRFWWPAIMGDEVAEPPAEGDADFDGRLLASNAQSAEISRLASGFRRGFHGGKAYNLKDLLAELVLSKWFRADAASNADPARATALASAGAKRLLTSEELARKTVALTGFDWRRGRGQNWRRLSERLNWTNTEDQYGLLYGGIDSDGITKRGRDLTSVMAGVAERHAATTSCPVVMKDFYLLPDEDRRLFQGFDVNTSPVTEFEATFEIEAASWNERETRSLSGWLQAGQASVTLSFLNDFYDDVHGDRNLRFDRLEIRDERGNLVISQELEDLAPENDCNHPVGDHFALHCTGSVEVPLNLPSEGRYDIDVVTWGDQAGDELPRLAISVGSDPERSAGSRAIKAKLAELHHKLLGVEADADSEDVRSTYGLFVDVWQSNRNSEDHQFLSTRCDWHEDAHYFDGIADHLWQTEPDEWGNERGWDWDAANDLIWYETDMPDPHHVARTWVAVLAYLMTDPRYLHL